MCERGFARRAPSRAPATPFAFRSGRYRISVSGNRVRDVRLIESCYLRGSLSESCAAAIASSRCSTFVAPTIGAVTPGLCSNHARAICAPVTPRRRDLSRTVNDGEVNLGVVEAVAEGIGVGTRRQSLAFARPIAGEQSACKRAPGQHSNALSRYSEYHLLLLLAVNEVVVVLHRSPTASSPPPTRALGELPRSTCLARPDVACLAGLDHIVECLHVSAIGVSGAQPVDLGRGRRSRVQVPPERRIDPEARMCLRDRPRPFSPGMVGKCTFVATTYSSRMPNSRCKMRPVTTSL